MSRLRSDSFSPPQPVTPAHLKQESLVHDQKYRGAPKDGYCGKEETIVVNWKEGIVLAAHKYRSNPNAFHPHFKSCKKEVTCKCRTIK